jgi:hypothetical protein
MQAKTQRDSHKISEANYRSHGASLRREYEAETRKTSGDPNSLCWIVRQLGNIYWEFGEFAEARRWFLEEVDLLAANAGWHSDAVAFAYWKAGELGRMRAECRAVVTQRLAEVAPLERAGAPGGEAARILGLRYFDLAMASFLLGELLDGESWGEKAREVNASVFGRRAKAEMAVVGFSRALRQGDAAEFAVALRFLRSLLRGTKGFGGWPTLLSSGNADLYRYALSLSRERFGAIPKDLAAELLSPSGGESVDFVAILREGGSS